DSAARRIRGSARPEGPEPSRARLPVGSKLRPWFHPLNPTPRCSLHCLSDQLPELPQVCLGHIPTCAHLHYRHTKLVLVAIAHENHLGVGESILDPPGCCDAI